MSEYAYKVVLENDTCLAKRAVAFHDTRFLRFEQLQKIAIKHLTSQTCYRCGKNHSPNDFVVIEATRGEEDQAGWLNYRDIKPSRLVEPTVQQELF